MKISWSNFWQPALGFAGLAVGGASIAISVWLWAGQRNAKLVEIGVSVLRVDPQKNSQIAGAREWAISLIDANAGVKFTPTEKAELMKKPLKSDGYYGATYDLSGDYSGGCAGGGCASGGAKAPAPTTH